MTDQLLVSMSSLFRLTSPTQLLVFIESSYKNDQEHVLLHAVTFSIHHVSRLLLNSTTWTLIKQNQLLGQITGLHWWDPPAPFGSRCPLLLLNTVSEGVDYLYLDLSIVSKLLNIFRGSQLCNYYKHFNRLTMCPCPKSQHEDSASLFKRNICALLPLLIQRETIAGGDKTLGMTWWFWPLLPGVVRVPLTSNDGL